MSEVIKSFPIFFNNKIKVIVPLLSIWIRLQHLLRMMEV